MSTITKESIADTIEGLEHLANSGIQSVYIDMAIAGMRRLLASLEAKKCAEPVAFINGAWTLVYYRPPKELGLKVGDKLYTAPPVPVSVPTFDEWLEIRGNKPLGWVKDAMRESYDACRAAMLNQEKGNG